MQKRGFQLKNSSAIRAQLCRRLNRKNMPESYSRTSATAHRCSTTQTFRRALGNVDLHTGFRQPYFFDPLACAAVSVGNCSISMSLTPARWPEAITACRRECSVPDPAGPARADRSRPYSRAASSTSAPGRNDLGGLHDGLAGREYVVPSAMKPVRARAPASARARRAIISPGWFFTPKQG